MQSTFPRYSAVEVLGALLIVSFLSGCQAHSAEDFEQRLLQIQQRRAAAGPRPRTAQRQNVSASSDWLGLPTSEGPRVRREADFVLASYQAESEGPQELATRAVSSDATRGPLSGFAETLKRDLKRWPADLWQDTVRVYTDPMNVIILAGAGGATIALRQHADEDNAEFFEENHHFGQGWRDALSFVGSPATHFVLGGVWYAVGVGTQDEKTYEVGRTLIDALTINGLSTLAIKYVSNRDSPNGEAFAFPSGHTSSSVTFATVMHEAYGPWVGVPLYGLSALVAIERLDDGEHWVSDVVFGAALGWVVGRTVADGRRPEILGGEIAPYVSPDGGFSGIAWIKTFD